MIVIVIVNSSNDDTIRNNSIVAINKGPAPFVEELRYLQ